MDARPPITVAITRFEDLLALGLHAALDSDPTVTVVAEDIAPRRVGVVLRAHRPQVLILDVGALRDFGEVRELRLDHPDTRLVLLGHDLSGVESAQLLAFGVSACLPKSTQSRDLRHAIHLASRGLQLQLVASGAHIATARDSLLTAREGDVLQLLREGQSNAEIALALRIGVETVRSHARNIYRKLGVSSRRTLLAGSTAPAGSTIPAVSLPAPPRIASRPLVRRP